MRAEVSKKMEFAAAHFLPDYNGKCSQTHGHTWEVEVTISGEIDDKTGMVVDFSLVKKILEPIIDQFFDHHLLNDTINNPTAENIAQWLFEAFREEMGHYKIFHSDKCLEAVTVWESRDSKATVRG
jgi:6-pyruvoyltetrahydropterin/6-carboxytetrahydropterin synthase